MKEESFHYLEKKIEQPHSRSSSTNLYKNSSIKTIYSVMTNLIGSGILVFPLNFKYAGNFKGNTSFLFVLVFLQKLCI